MQPERMPVHVGLVMDGNGRWAKARGLARTEGHRQGEEPLFDCIEAASAIGIQYLSVFAFSTENWRRSPEEVRFLMGYNREVLRRRRNELLDMNVRVVWSGERRGLWRSVSRELDAAQVLTSENSGLAVQFCLNYGGRAEILHAVRNVARDVASGALRPEDITEETLAEHLYQPTFPPLDMIIRTGGEKRLSNFLLWQSTSAVIVSTEVMWPDFNGHHLRRICAGYRREVLGLADS